MPKALLIPNTTECQEILRVCHLSAGGREAPTAIGLKPDSGQHALHAPESSMFYVKFTNVLLKNSRGVDIWHGEEDIAWESSTQDPSAWNPGSCHRAPWVMGMVARVTGSLPPTWESQKEFLPCSFRLAQASWYRHLQSESETFSLLPAQIMTLKN